MQTMLLALFAGFLVGVFFTAMKLPLPAPPFLSGVLGILGIYLGGIAYHWFIDYFFRTQ